MVGIGNRQFFWQNIIRRKWLILETVIPETIDSYEFAKKIIESRGLDLVNKTRLEPICIESEEIKQRIDRLGFAWKSSHLYEKGVPLSSRKSNTIVSLRYLNCLAYKRTYSEVK